MNAGYQEYISFLRTNREQIKSDLLIPQDSWRRALYSSVFDKYFIPTPEYSEPNGVISATDSSEILRELYSGKKLVLFRSLTTGQKMNYSSFITKLVTVAREDVQRYTIMNMEHSEHLSILKMLDNESPDYILVDGSITGRIFSEELRVNSDDFTSFRKEYFETLASLLKTAISRGIPLIFMAKSSDSSIFRDFLLSTMHEDKELIDAEKKKRSSDHFIIKSMASYPGYTVPLERNMKLSSYKSSFDISIMTTHILPDIRDLPIKVEIISSANEQPGTVPEGILDILFWGYAGIKVYNIWLSRVDDIVKFRSEETENVFMRAFEKEIGISLYETRGERRARIRI